MIRQKLRAFFSTWRNNIWQMMTMSMLFTVMNALLLPGGLAAVGLTDVAVKLARQNYFYGLSDFFIAMGKNWKQALVVGIGNVVCMAGLGLMGWFYLSQGGWLGAFGLVLTVMALVILSFMKYYIWPQIVLFRLPLITICKNAFLFAFINLKNNFVIGGVCLACYGLAFGLMYYMPIQLSTTLIALVALVFFPGFKYILTQTFVYPCLKEYMIDPYYRQHPDEDVETRKNMGIY